MIEFIQPFRHPAEPKCFYLMGDTIWCDYTDTAIRLHKPDIIAVNVALPEIESGDVLAVLSTGAYNYSMASNYNRNFVPAAVLVRDGNADVIIKKQTYEDLVRNDVVPQRLK